mgnify:CR=1 FL=1
MFSGNGPKWLQSNFDVAQNGAEDAQRYPNMTSKCPKVTHKCPKMTIHHGLSWEHKLIQEMTQAGELFAVEESTDL